MDYIQNEWNSNNQPTYFSLSNAHFTSMNLYHPCQRIQLNFGDGRQIVLSDTIEYSGFNDPAEATLAFLDKLVELFPGWQRGLY